MSFFCTAELWEEPGLALGATSLQEKCLIKVSKGLIKLLECFEEQLSQSCWPCRTEQLQGSAGHSPSSECSVGAGSSHPTQLLMLQKRFCIQGRKV